MKAKFKYIIASLLCIISTGSLYAQGQHWQFDPYAWEYDMTAYVSLTLNNKTVDNLTDYEIAAFCGTECRGVATIQSSEKDGQTTVYGYLRIRSNQQAGETISFKVYNSVFEKEYDVDDYSLTFQSQHVIGLPSSPVVLPFADVMMGDADGDGRITINDAVLTINATFGTDPAGFNRLAADMDGDGRVTINDAILIINLTF